MKQRQPITNRFPNLASLGPITTQYGGKTAYENVHPGVDIAAKKGTPLPSPVSGTVVSAVNGKKNGDQGFGNFVTLKTQDGETHQLGHLNAEYVKPGQQVQAGQTIGQIGNSGAAYSPSGQGDGSHLDWRIMTAYKKYRNPLLNK